jgi:ABC-2 type transport system permease protein
MIAVYAGYIRFSILQQLQYRAANWFFLIGMVVEPVVYLVVWRTIAEQQGGSVEGITAGQFAAYFIVWTLVRNMNIVLTPFAWEERIKEGSFATQLLRPIHPIHEDLAGFIGWKFVMIAMWLPIGAVLTAIFRPDLSPRLLQVAVFLVAIWGAYLIRALLQWALGMITFWTTRVAAIFEAYYLSEMVLSGRLFPIRLLPDWAERLTWFLPFRWGFAFPITALTGPITDRELMIGLGMQLLWTSIGALVVRLTFSRAVRRFSSVGN